MNAELLSSSRAKSWADEYGPSFYVLWSATLRENYARLKSAFALEGLEVRLAYSYKTNYLPAICKSIHSMGGMAEVVSSMEWEMAGLYGVPPRSVVYNGPNKSFQSFREALLGKALLQVDNRRDWDMLTTIVDQEEVSADFGVRLNFELMAGHESRFGVAVESPLLVEITDAVRHDARLNLRGLHCHFPDRDPETFALRLRTLLQFFEELSDTACEYLNIGGGFMGELSATASRSMGLPRLTFPDYAQVLRMEMLTVFPDLSAAPSLILEPGTALVADVLSFVTTVVDVREVRGRRIATVDGSLFNTSPYARRRTLPFKVIGKSAATSAGGCDVAGFTCIESDILAYQAPFELEVGDQLVFDNVGSYSIVMKPPFILPSPPIVEVSDDLVPRVVRRRETVSDLLRTYRI